MLMPLPESVSRCREFRILPQIPLTFGSQNFGKQCVLCIHEMEGIFPQNDQGAEDGRGTTDCAGRNQGMEFKGEGEDKVDS